MSVRSARRSAPRGPSPEQIKMRQDSFRIVTSRAETFLENGKLLSAYRQYAIAAETAARAKMTQQAQQLGAKINGALEQELTQANDQYRDENYRDALKTYRLIAAMHKLNVAKDARHRLISSMNDPKLQSFKREIEAAERYDKIIALLERKTANLEDEDTAVTITAMSEVNDELSQMQRLSMLRASDRESIVRMMRAVAKYYEDTSTGEQARELVDSLPVFIDDQQAEKIAKAECCKQLDMANLYMDSNLRDKAVELYHQVINDNPESGCADNAQEQIDSLGALLTVNG